MYFMEYLMILNLLLASTQTMGDEKAYPEFYFLRHGTTKPNAEGNIIGSKTDKPLNELGQKQAEEARKTVSKLPIENIYSSPLLRTQETANIVNKNNKNLVTVEELTEQDLGEWELKKVEFFLPRYRGGQGESPVGGEENKTFFNRIEKTINKLLQQESAPFLIVGHYGLFYALLNQFNLKTDIQHFKNCMVMKVEKNKQNEWIGNEVMSDYEKATQLFESGKHNEAQQILEDLLKEDHLTDPDYIKERVLLGAVYDELSRHDDAEKILINAIETYRKNPEKNEVDLAFALMHLGKVYSQLAQFDASKKVLSESITIYEKHPQKKHLIRATTLLAEMHMYSRGL